MQRVLICVKGLVDEQRTDWFEGLQVIPIEPDSTIIAGQVVDHAALYGLLAAIRDLGALPPDTDLDVVSVNGFISGSEKSYWYDLASWTVEGKDVTDTRTWPDVDGRSFSGYERMRAWRNDGFYSFLFCFLGNSLTHQLGLLYLIHLLAGDFLRALVVHVGLAGICSEYGGQDAEAGGFSRPIGSQQTNNFTLFNAHRYLVYDPSALIFFDKIVCVQLHGK